MAQLMPLALTVSCFSKIQIGFTFLYQLTRIVPERGPLNGCCCCIISIRCILLIKCLQWQGFVLRRCFLLVFVGVYTSRSKVLSRLTWCAVVYQCVLSTVSYAKYRPGKIVFECCHSSIYSYYFGTVRVRINCTEKCILVKYFPFSWVRFCQNFIQKNSVIFTRLGLLSCHNATGKHYVCDVCGSKEYNFSLWHTFSISTPWTVIL